MERKIVVPDEMVDAAYKALKDAYLKVSEGAKLDTHIVLVAALRWLAENPIVPTMEQAHDMTSVKRPLPLDVYEWVRWGACEWQRIMFLAPELEIPEVLNDLLVQVHVDLFGCEPRLFNERIIEAYRRGQKAGKS